MSKWSEQVAIISSFFKMLGNDVEKWDETYDRQLFDERQKAQNAIGFLITGKENLSRQEYTPTEVVKGGFNFDGVPGARDLAEKRDDVLAETKRCVLALAKKLQAIPDLDVDFGALSKVELAVSESKLQLQIAQLQNLINMTKFFDQVDDCFVKVDQVLDDVSDRNRRLNKKLGEKNNELFDILTERYGETMSAKDIADFFKCTTRTVSNWEDQGYLNRLEENDNWKTTSAGRKIRGATRHFLTRDVASCDLLKQRFKCS